jgi:uncharacterized membrane protein YphA (DoxX/SURF4 family)
LDIILWVLQIALGIKFASVVFTHGLRTGQPKMKQGIEKMGAAARPVLGVVAVGALVGAVGLVLPAAMKVAPWLTPWAAALLAVMMLVAAVLHMRCREAPNLPVSLVLFALAAFVAVGRWVLAPF